MSPEERELVLSLVTSPGRGGADPDEVLRRFGVADGQVLGVELLRDALERRDSTDVEMALIVTAVFGVSQDHLGPLLALASADWHHSHENVVTALASLKSPAAIDTLRHLAQWVPDYLDYDDSRALAVKAVRALGAIPVGAADDALASLLGSGSEIVRAQASRQLERRRPV